MPKASTNTPAGRERVIEEAIMLHRKLVGFPRADAIRNCPLFQRHGRLDLLLLPKMGPKLVLIEAKACDSADAASKVIGQLMMYYSAALRLGEDGLENLRTFAKEQAEHAKSPGKKSAVQYLEEQMATPDAWKRLGRGRKIQPEEIRLYVAIDGEPHQALEPTLLALRKHHGIKIGLIQVVDGVVTVRGKK